MLYRKRRATKVWGLSPWNQEVEPGDLLVDQVLGRLYRAVEICYRGNVLASIPHSELRDLFYVIQQSMRQAKLKLGDDAQEV